MSLNLTAELGLDGKAFALGLNQAKGSALSFAKDLKGQVAGAFAVAASVQGLKAAAEFASKIQDLSDATDIETDSLQKLDYAAAVTGGSLEQLAKSMKFLAKARAEALKSPGGEASKDFASIGISGEYLKNTKDLITLMNDVSKGFQDADMNADMLVVATRLLGKNAESVLPALRNGLKEAADEAERLGLIIAPKTIKNLDTYGDEWTQFGKKMKGAAAETVSAWAMVHHRLAAIFDNMGDFAKTAVGAFIPHQGGRGVMHEEFRELGERMRGRNLNTMQKEGHVFRIKMGDTGGSTYRENEDGVVIPKAEDLKKYYEQAERMKKKSIALDFEQLSTEEKLQELYRQHFETLEKKPKTVQDTLDQEEKLLEIQEEMRKVEKDAAREGKEQERNKQSLQDKMFQIRSGSLSGSAKEAALKAEMDRLLAAGKFDKAADIGSQLASIYTNKPAAAVSDNLSRIGGFTGAATSQMDTTRQGLAKVEAILNKLRDGLTIKEVQ